MDTPHLLFFDRSGPTKQIWYYENPKRENGNYSKSKPMQFEEFADCLTWWKHREENERAWKVAASDILADNCNLDRRNPSSQADLVHTPPDQLIEAIISKETRLLQIVTELRDVLKKHS